MNFIKASVYQQEITQSGIKEKETSSLGEEEQRLQERLAKLPEFQRDPQFRSLSEQIQEGSPPEAAFPTAAAAAEATQNPYAPASVTEDDFAFYEALRKQEKSRNALRFKEEKEMREAFAKARQASDIISQADNSRSSRLKSPLPTPSMSLSGTPTSLKAPHHYPVKSVLKINQDCGAAQHVTPVKCTADATSKTLPLTYSTSNRSPYSVGHCDDIASGSNSGSKSLQTVNSPTEINFFAAASRQSKTDTNSIVAAKNRLFTPPAGKSIPVMQKKRLGSSLDEIKGAVNEPDIAAHKRAEVLSSVSPPASNENAAKKMKAGMDSPVITASVPHEEGSSTILGSLLEGYSSSDSSDSEVPHKSGN